MAYKIGIDIGGTKCAVILCDTDKTEKSEIRIIKKIIFETAKETPYSMLELFSKTIQEYINIYSITQDRLAGIGISCGGPLDSKRGIILSPPNLPGWDEIRINDYLHRQFNVPVILENDANASAIAEWKYGAGKGYKNIVFLTFGTGMGAGLILNGQLYSGANDHAGEIGHVRMSKDGPVGYGKAGSFEGFCSGGGIKQLAQEIIKSKYEGAYASFCKNKEGRCDLSAKTIAEAATAGNETAKEIYAISGRYLGKGLSMIIDFINPEIIIIGSIFSRSRDLLWPYAKEVIKEEALPDSASICKIVPAALGDKLGDYASVSLLEGIE